MKVGVVPYINGKPLTRNLAGHLPEAEIVEDVPSSLARRMLSGEVHAALVSSIFCLAERDVSAAPEICIAGDGHVGSVMLFCAKDPSRIKTVGLDPASLSSRALAKIVLAEAYGVRPEFVELDPSVQTTALDAQLQIGDGALARGVNEPGLDLGEEWRKLTGLPFVYALWGIRRHAANDKLLDGLRRAKQDGLADVASIARTEAARVGLDEGLCLRYLTRLIRYDLGRREIEGLEAFARLARSHGLIPREAKIELAG